MKILVLLTCHNRKNKTLKCIETLMKQSDFTWRFIIVDDNSTDGTFEELKKYENVLLLKGNGNLYYSRGMRLAIEQGKKKREENYDYVLLVNDDVDFYDHSIEKLIAYLNNDFGIMVGATEWNGKLTYGGVTATSRLKPSYKTVMSDTNRIVCDTFNANCVLIPYGVFFSLDNIDVIYQHSMGDYDYGFAAKTKGVPIFVSNFFVGKCSRNSIKDTWSDNTLSRKQRLKLKESPKGLPLRIWFYYLKKNYGLFTAIVYSIIPYMKILLGIS